MRSSSFLSLPSLPSFLFNSLISPLQGLKWSPWSSRVLFILGSLGCVSSLHPNPCQRDLLSFPGTHAPRSFAFLFAPNSPFLESLFPTINLLPLRDFPLSRPAAFLEVSTTPFPKVIRTLLEESRREHERLLSVMERSHTASLWKASNPSAMAFIPAPGTTSHASQAPVQTPKPPFARLVHIEVANLLLARRHPQILTSTPMDLV